MLLTIVTAPIIARAIGPVGRGESATALAAFSVVPIVVALGLPLQLRRVMATQNVRAAIRSVRDLCVLLFVPSGLLAVLLYVSIFASMDTPAATISAVGVLLAPLTVSWLCDQSVMIARSNYRAVALLQIAQPLVYVAAVLLGFLFSILSVPYILSANILGASITFALGLHLCRASFLGTRLRRRDMLRGGVRFAGSAVAETATNRLDQLLVLPLIGGFASGLYSVAVTISSIPLSLGHALGAHFFNISARARTSSSEVAVMAIRYGLIASFAVAIPIVVTAPLLVPLVFGGEFSSAVPLVIIGQFGSIAMTASYVGSMVLAGRGEGRRMLIAQLASLGVGIPMLFVLAPHLSALGAAIASLAGYLVLLAVTMGSLGIGFRGLAIRVSDFRGVVVALK
jgi:O-antigen/teichoic acid export membrane protein